MAFASLGAMGAVSDLPSVSDRMTRAICDIRKRRGCIHYAELARDFSDDEIVDHLRESLSRARLRMRAPWPTFPAQIAVDERVISILSKDERAIGLAQSERRKA